MKRMISILLVLSLALLGGCGNPANPSSSSNTPSSSQPSSQSAPSFDTSKAIHVITREDGSGTRGAFIELFGIQVKDENGNKVDKTTEDAAVAKATDVMMQTVAGDPYAIGYISLGSLNSTVKALQINGVDATAANVKDGSYEVARPFMIATKGEATGVTADFIKYILSNQGQEVVAKSYISLDASEDYTATGLSGKIVVAGSSSVTPIMEKLSEAYRALNPDVSIEIQMTDSTAGMTAAMEGTCDIGMASRELSEAELAQLTATQIAIDGIAVVVSPENTVTGLTNDQVNKIFTGEATTWSEVA